MTNAKAAAGFRFGMWLSLQLLLRSSAPLDVGLGMTNAVEVQRRSSSTSSKTSSKKSIEAGERARTEPEIQGQDHEQTDAERGILGWSGPMFFSDSEGEEFMVQQTAVPLGGLAQQDLDAIAVPLRTESVSVYFSTGGGPPLQPELRPALKGVGAENPGRARARPKCFEAEMGVLPSAYDLSVPSQRRKARAQYEQKGFAHVVPARAGSRTNPYGMPLEGRIADHRKLRVHELVGLAKSNEWKTWLKKVVIQGGGLTRLPEEDEGGWHETSPASRVWNEQSARSDRLRSGDDSRPDDPRSFGWAGAGDVACDRAAMEGEGSPFFKFFTECPPSFWDAVAATEEATKRRHARELPIGVLEKKKNRKAYDRALFVWNVVARDAGASNSEDVVDIVQPLPTVHADVTLENLASGHLRTWK
eukprot:g1247.t1